MFAVAGGTDRPDRICSLTRVEKWLPKTDPEERQETFALTGLTGLTVPFPVSKPALAGTSARKATPAATGEREPTSSPVSERTARITRTDGGMVDGGIGALEEAP